MAMEKRLGQLLLLSLVTAATACMEASSGELRHLPEAEFGARDGTSLSPEGIPMPSVEWAPRGQTAPQSYFEWTRLPFPASEYEDRRRRTAAALPTGVDVLLVASVEGTSDGGTFRQDDDFMYLTGLEVPRSVLALPRDAADATIFAPASDHRFQSASRPNDFPGRPLADDPSLGAQAGVSIRDLTELDAYLSGLAAQGRTVAVLADPSTSRPSASLFGVPRSTAQRLAGHLAAQHAGLEITDGRSALATARSIKSTAEIERLRAAAELTIEAIRVAMGEVEDGVDERTLEAAFEAACKRGGSARVPFDPIIKSGPNSLWPWRILAAHYERRHREMRDGELVIFDVGCEVDQYVSDVGRTVPVSGRFTPEQRAILEMETAVADRVIEAIRPGVTFADLRQVAYDAIPDPFEPAMQVGLFFGHHLGLSTGDPAHTDGPLAAGMVFTVEPWYYDHSNEISVFTEDVILVTEDGAEVLSAGLPRTPEALERLVGARK